MVTHFVKRSGQGLVNYRLDARSLQSHHIGMICDYIGILIGIGCKVKEFFIVHIIQTHRIIPLVIAH